MSSLSQKIVKKVFNKFGIGYSNQEDAKKYELINSAFERLLFIIKKNNSENSSLAFLGFAADKLLKSESQLFQDLFVLYTLNSKTNGFFVEFGATNGKSLSNTYLLEKEFGWKGIVAEPGKVWHEDLHKNRSCIIEDRCVWSSTGEELIFFETTNMAELSTIKGYAETDYFSEERTQRKEYRVQTISLNDLLKFHKAPDIIDYLSVDTEGSEFEILKGVDFSKYKFRTITVEHNLTAIRDEIFTLLNKNNYKRVHQDISAFDDWYTLDC